jgi:hypothetical protein
VKYAVRKLTSVVLDFRTPIDVAMLGQEYQWQVAIAVCADALDLFGTAYKLLMVKIS